jgi:hypothetical protein
LTPKLERLIHTLEWARIEESCPSRCIGTGRPPHERAWLANAFLAKAVLGIPQTRTLHERLTVDRSLRRICGFPVFRKLPSESTLFRAFVVPLETNRLSEARRKPINQRMRTSIRKAVSGIHLRQYRLANSARRS